MALGLTDECSFRVEFLAFTGIFPDIYRAARPAPALSGGRRRAMIEVDRGMIVVSSSYSNGRVSNRFFKKAHTDNGRRTKKV